MTVTEQRAYRRYTRLFSQIARLDVKFGLCTCNGGKVRTKSALRRERELRRQMRQAQAVFDVMYREQMTD